MYTKYAFWIWPPLLDSRGRSEMMGNRDRNAQSRYAEHRDGFAMDGLLR